MFVEIPRSASQYWLRCGKLVSLLLLLTGESLGVASAASPIDIGSRKQLFVDDYLIESSDGIKLVMHSPQRDGRVLVTNDQPWETHPRMYINAYCSILKDNGIVRLWYDLWERDENWNGKHGREGYAESKDGLVFTKPLQHQYDVNGSRANNIVLPGSIGGTAVWIDDGAPQEHRYKTQAKIYPSGEFHMHSSPDGLRWKLFARPDTGSGDVDSQSIIFWDRHIERYALYTRFWKSHRHKTAPKPEDHRTVRRLESDDLLRWDNQVVVMQPDEVDVARHSTPATPPGKPSIDYYGACVFPYGDQRLYIMLAQAYWHWIPRKPRELDLGPSGGPAAIDVRLGISRDGIHFDLAGNRAPFMALGPEGGFDSKSVWVIPNPIRMGDELWIYYRGTNRDHDDIVDPHSSGKVLSGIGRAVLRLDGFVSANADHTGGEIVTPPITFQGDRLELNVDTSGGGSVHVELLNEQGGLIPGFSREEAITVNGNSVRKLVRWNGVDSDVSPLSGRPIKIRFILHECHLYAFQFVK